MSRIDNARQQIEGGWQQLGRQWRTTSGLWRDPMQRGFERDVWQEFERIVPSTMDEMKRLAATIAQARSEVP